MTPKKSYHELFARFFEMPSRESFRALLKENVGELRCLDFKEQWLDHSGLSKHILGIANSGGGCLVIGVEEIDDGTLLPKGLSSLTDKADIVNGIKNYIPNSLYANVDILDFSFDASEYNELIGKKFHVLFVECDAGHMPFVSLRSGSGIRSGAIYIRREGATEEASHDELQRLLNLRISGGVNTTKEICLKDHVDQLRVLFDAIPRRRQAFHFAAIGMMMVNFNSEPNPLYPEEDFDSFILKMILKKKKRVADELGVSVD